MLQHETAQRHHLLVLVPQQQQKLQRQLLPCSLPIAVVSAAKVQG
jgi:hypothetical protein